MDSYQLRRYREQADGPVNVGVALLQPLGPVHGLEAPLDPDATYQIYPGQARASLFRPLEAGVSLHVLGRRNGELVWLTRTDSHDLYPYWRAAGISAVYVVRAASAADALAAVAKACK
jgi:hypothetical protein